MIDNQSNNIDNSIDNMSKDIDTQIESVVDEYSEAIKKLAESIILNPDDQSKWLDAQSLIQVPLKQAIKALLIQSKIDELENLKEAQSLWSHSGDIYCKGANARKADIDKQIKQRIASLKRELT